MRTTKSEKQSPWMLARLPVLLLAAPLSAGCIVVADDTCSEGSFQCNGDFVQECVDDDWVDIEDCNSLCSGTCTYLNDVPGCSC